MVRRAAARLAAVMAGIALVASAWGSAALADPAEDALAKLNELSRQAEQMTEAMHSAQLDLDAKVRTLAAAEKTHTEDVAALSAARDRLVGYQGAVDRLAASPASTVAEIRRSYERQKEIDATISSISAHELDITKENDKVVIRFAYEKEIELFGPVYLLIKYAGRSK